MGLGGPWVAPARARGKRIGRRPRRDVDAEKVGELRAQGRSWRRLDENWHGSTQGSSRRAAGFQDLFRGNPCEGCDPQRGSATIRRIQKEMTVEQQFLQESNWEKAAQKHGGRERPY